MLVDQIPHRTSATFEQLLKHLKWVIPEGGSLPAEVWQSRHRGILALLWFHAFGIVCFGLLVGASLAHSLVEGAILAAIAAVASWKKGHRLFRSSIASFGLITASAEVVHLSGGYIEMHFHFFVMLAVIILYQEWLPFLLAIAYVFIHHGVFGVLDPFAVYNHPDAFAHPWKWAAIHGGFVLAASIASIVSWRLDEALRAYSELILNSTGEGIIGLDPQGNIIFMNPAAQDMTGYQVEELKGQPLALLLHPPGLRPSLNENWLQNLIGANAVQSVNEGVFWRKTGLSFMAEYVSTPIHQADTLMGTVVAFKDITERTQAQEALQKAKEELEIRVAERTAELEEANKRLRFELAERQRTEADLIDSEARYKAITAAVPGAIYQFTSRNGVWTVDYMAPQTLELFGVSAEDFMEDINNFIGHIYPDDLPIFVASVTEAVENLTPWNYEGRVINPKTGELLWWQGMSTPVATTSGEIIFNGILLNITERKQAEAALRQSEQRFRQVISSISDHIYVTELMEDGQHLNLYLSHHVEALTGYPLDRFMADWSFWPSTVIHPDDRIAAAAQARRLAQGQNSELEYRLVRANGDIIWVRDSGRVERDPVRQTLIIYGLVSDITERKAAETVLARARDEALASSRLKTELLAKVSHELRTPLGAILGFAEMLELSLDGPQADRQKEMAAEIIDSTHYLTKMVNELLDQAQLEAGRLELYLKPFAPADLLEDTLAKMSVLAQAKGLRLAGEIAPEVPLTLISDIVRLQQILVNLISNAIKFTAAGSVQVRLYCPDPARWAMQVSDTGAGIPAEAQNYIFEPFRQVDGSITREYGGTGLGLSIVKQLTTLMGGEINLVSAAGQGSTFTIFLPIQLNQEKTV